MRQLRSEKNFTQERVAELAQISRPTYTSIELGMKNPSLPVAMKLKKIFNYYDDDIFLVNDVTKTNK